MFDQRVKGCPATHASRKIARLCEARWESALEMRSFRKTRCRTSWEMLSASQTYRGMRILVRTLVPCVTHRLVIQNFPHQSCSFVEKKESVAGYRGSKLRTI